MLPTRPPLSIVSRPPETWTVPVVRAPFSIETLPVARSKRADCVPLIEPEPPWTTMWLEEAPVPEKAPPLFTNTVPLEGVVDDERAASTEVMPLKVLRP